MLLLPSPSGPTASRSSLADCDASDSSLGFLSGAPLWSRLDLRLLLEDLLLEAAAAEDVDDPGGGVREGTEEEDGGGVEDRVGGAGDDFPPL